MVIAHQLSSSCINIHLDTALKKEIFDPIGRLLLETERSLSFLTGEQERVIELVSYMVLLGRRGWVCLIS